MRNPRWVFFYIFGASVTAWLKLWTCLKLCSEKTVNGFPSFAADELDWRMLDTKLLLSKNEETPVHCILYSVKWADLLQWRRFRSCDAMNPLHYNEGGHLSFFPTNCLFDIYHSMKKQKNCLADFTTVLGT